MNNALKILIGIAILIIGIWTMINPLWLGHSSWYYGLNWWVYTWDIIKGSFGPMTILIGIVFIWMTYEESKI